MPLRRWRSLAQVNTANTSPRATQILYPRFTALCTSLSAVSPPPAPLRPAPVLSAQIGHSITLCPPRPTPPTRRQWRRRSHCSLDRSIGVSSCLLCLSLSLDSTSILQTDRRMPTELSCHCAARYRLDVLFSESIGRRRRVVEAVVAVHSYEW